MATPPQLTQIAFAGGLDEAQETEVLDPTRSFPVLTNGRQDKRGGYAKRLGFAALSASRFDATTRTAGRRLFDLNGQPCTVDGTYADVYDAGKSTSVVVSKLPEVSVTTKTLALSVYGTLYGVVHCNGYVVAIGDGGPTATTFGATTVFGSVETVDGQVVSSQRIVLALGTSARVNALLLTYSTYVIAVMVADNSADVRASYINLASASTIATGWVAMTNPATDKVVAGSGAYIISGHSLSDRVAFAYVNNSGGASQLTVKTLNASGVVETATINTASVTPDVVGVEGSNSDRLWVCWNQTTTIKLVGLTPTAIGTPLSTAATIGTAGSTPNINAPAIMSSGSGAGRIMVQSTDGILFAKWTTSAGAVTPDGGTNTLAGMGFAGRPFLRGGRYYAPFHASVSNTQQLFVVCDWTDANSTQLLRPIANIAPGLVPIDLAMKHVHPWTVTADQIAYGLSVNDSAAVLSPVTLATLDFADIDRWRSAAFAEGVYMTGGVPSYVNGSTTSEIGFLHSPQKPTLAVGGTGLTGTYRYVAVYEGVDRAGNWVMSGVSLPSEPITPANQSISATTTGVAFTNRDTALSTGAYPTSQVSWFRTDGTGNPPYYYVASSLNGTGGLIVLSSDALSDATLRTRRLLYGTGNLPGTNGAPQDRRAPPHAQAIATYGDMMVLASGADLWYSGQLIQGEGVWFNPLFSLTVPGPGSVKALAVQDGTLYAFKETAIYAISGEPPVDNGTSGGLGTPRQLATDVGATGPVVCVTSAGIWFVSRRGIEVLTRSGTVLWIGEGVQRTLASYPVVTAIVLDPVQNLVRITCAASETSGVVGGNGVQLVYDLALQTWISVDSVYGASASQPAQDAAMVTVGGQQRFAWMSSAGIIYYEKLSSDADACLDGSQWVTLSAETSWFKASGLQGKQHLNRVLVLARKSTDFDLSVSLAYNYESGWRSARTWTKTEINALLTSGWPITQLKHDAHDDAECQSVRVKLTDATPTAGTVGNGKGATWLGLTLDLVPKPGAFELSEEAA